jgi:prepilin-type N-terminal cleavage/methylation domain-containing protein
MLDHMRHGQAGFSLVELMVGLTLGLTLLACTLAAWGTQLRSTQQMANQAQLAHAVNTVGLVVSRNLRRAALHIDHSAAVPEFKFTPNPSPQANPTPFAYRLRSGVLEMQLGSSAWQALTDPRTMRITVFDIAQDIQTQQLHSLCTRACANTPHTMDTPPSSICPPQQDMHLLTLHIQAQAAPPLPPTPKQDWRTAVHLRSSPITGQCSP